ncbi:hypothetical protein AOCH_003424 [Aspergillus ochraceoroseus]|uniref:Uncharacterized protein n=1 Tax=Aspergillus ochraceoroseus TaxID=138278 RepID=A0A0F8U5V7_9EURO|nr:hypothetical protein AOCH_003424 [Aspergillus ochraceoroseus]
MSLSSLPNELIAIIAENLDSETEINALVCSHKRFYLFLNRFLYRYHVRNNSSSALLWATRHRQPSTLQKLLEAGAEVPLKNFPSELTGELEGFLGIIQSIGAPAWFHPLTAAARSGSIACVQILLDHGVDPDYCDQNGNTALMQAAVSGHVAVVKLLLARGADILLPDRFHRSALSAAIEIKNMNLIKVLFAHLESGDYPATLLQERAQIILRTGIQSGRSEMIEFALGKGGDVNYQPPTDNLENPRDIYSSEWERLLQAIMQHGPPIPLGPQNPNVLYSSTVFGNEAAVKRALDLGADVHRFGWDALIQAVWDKHHGIIRLLVEKGMNLNNSEARWNILDYALQTEDEWIVKYLQDHGGVQKEHQKQQRPNVLD